MSDDAKCREELERILVSWFLSPNGPVKKEIMDWHRRHAPEKPQASSGEATPAQGVWPCPHLKAGEPYANKPGHGWWFSRDGVNWSFSDTMEWRFCPLCGARRPWEEKPMPEFKCLSCAAIYAKTGGGRTWCWDHRPKAPWIEDQEKPAEAKDPHRCEGDPVQCWNAAPSPTEQEKPAEEGRPSIAPLICGNCNANLWGITTGSDGFREQYDAPGVVHRCATPPAPQASEEDVERLACELRDVLCAKADGSDLHALARYILNRKGGA